MKMPRLLLAACLILGPVAFAAAFDRVLPAPRITDNGDVRLSDDLRIGRFQGGKFISQPDQIDAPGPAKFGTSIVPKAVNAVTTMGSIKSDSTALTVSNSVGVSDPVS